MERTLADLCTLLHGELIGDGGTVIRGINSFDDVGKDELTYADTRQHLARALASQAAGIVVSRDVASLESGRAGIRVEHPKLAFLLLLELFHPEIAPAAGVAPSAVVGKRVRLGRGVAVHPNAVIEDEVTVGPRTTIGAGVFLGTGVTIGEACVVHPNVVIYRGTQIGDRVRVHGGSVIGGDGFGYVFHEGRYIKIPQVGNVVIEDDVEIGANVCVDRATVGSTVIRQGTKIDNLVQIAHNDQIGKHVAMAGQVGLSGSVVVGDYVVMGGKAGIVDHVTVGRGAKIGAASVVTKSVPDGAAVWGFPARPTADVKRQMAGLGRLDALLRSVRELVARMHRSETRIAKLEEHAPEKTR